MLTHKITHITFVLDASSSMQHLESQVVTVFEGQIATLASRSKELGHEVRVSVYKFADDVECLVSDIDVLRLPSIKEHYKVYGNTALLKGMFTAIEDAESFPTKYGDHSHLLLAISDGQNNRNNELSAKLSSKINSLPESFTCAILVPNATAVHHAKSFGFPANCIQIWNTDKQGLEEVGQVTAKVLDNYLVSRTTSNFRGTKNLFNLDATKLTKTVIKSNLKELNPSEYYLLHVRKDGIEIKDFVESWKLPYIQGSAYFQLTKPEKIQAGKQVCIKNKLDGKVYAGTQAREIIGLPNHEVKVGAANYGDWLVFPQSTSVNRKLVGGTELIVVK
jgi:hypothetical protein